MMYGLGQESTWNGWQLERERGPLRWAIRLTLNGLRDQDWLLDCVMDWLLPRSQWCSGQPSSNDTSNHRLNSTPNSLCSQSQSLFGTPGQVQVCSLFYSSVWG